MKKGLTSALATVATAGTVFATLSLGISGGGQVNAASVASPAAAQTNSANTTWSVPVDVTQGGGYYDNSPSVGASQTNGAITMGWTRTVAGDTPAFVTQASNPAVGNLNFNLQDIWHGRDQQMGNVKVAHDSAGNRVIAFWALDGDTVGWVATVDANGNASPAQEVPGTRGANRKNVEVAVGPDNSVSVIFGQNLSNIYYYHRTPQGVWDVQGEKVPTVDKPTDMSIAVSTQGVVMVAYKDTAQGSNADIYTTTRAGVNQWTQINDVTAPCCTGCPRSSHTYLPSLASDPFGGIRMMWSDENCNNGPSGSNDIYYAEWKPTTGWVGQPLVRVAVNSGNSYYPSLAVDNTGTAQLVWADTTSSPVNYFRAFYTSGSGTTFGPVQLPADPYFGNSYQKNPDIDTSPGYVHIVYSSDRNDPQKESYYQYAPISGTAPAPTATPSPTPVPNPPPCPGETFTDNCPSSPFYQPILALNQEGVLSGYNTSPPCPATDWIDCFLPGANMTRQQTAKVIALAFHLPLNTVGGPHFTDVPPSNQFYTYIESAYNAGIIGGYADHTFRPANQVTRGQLSKMVSQAAGFNDAISGQTYQDVPTSNDPSSFYVYIERLSRRNIITGYACGTPGIPACQPGNLPYFLPSNNVTRGQAAKIVYGGQLAVPTATPSPTVTNTATPTNTTVPTSTFTPAPTNTETATSTAISTSTGTATASATGTSLPTVTATLAAGASR